MQDNFDLKKYLRHGNKLLNENIGGYVDLKPINQLGEDDSFIQAQRDAVGAKGSSTYRVDNENDIVTIDLDMAWDNDEAAQAAFDQYGIEVQDTNGNPGTFEVTGRKEDVLAYLKSKFYGMDDQDIATYYPELLDGEMSEGESEGDQYDGEYDSQFGPAITSELEKPTSIYATDDSEDEKGFVGPTRMMDLGGDKIENGIISLLDDGFEAEDVMDFCKMLIDAHSQGKKY
jgi:hypothetical protein